MSASGPQVSRDLPIIFSAPMVRALIREVEQPGTGKTQTRRLLPLQPPPEVSINYPLGDESWMPANKRSPRRHHFEAWAGPLYGSRPDGHLCGTFTSPQRYSVGDRLWVKEAWAPLSELTHNDPGTAALAENGFYRADGGTVDGEIGKWHPSIYMPRRASRLTLTVTDVRVQRLQDIETSDCYAEGCYRPTGPILGSVVCQRDNARGEYREIWNSIHGDKAWDANPWVCAISFSVERRNIDAKVAA